MGLEKDLPPGEQLVALFRPFLESLAASDLSPKTIQKHFDNMWALGGEFIRDLNDETLLRKRPVEQHLLKMIEYGALSFITAAEINRDPLSPPAGSSDASSPRPLAEHHCFTHRFPRRGIFLILKA